LRRFYGFSGVHQAPARSCFTQGVLLAAEKYGEGQPLVLLPWFGLDGAVMAAAFEPALRELAGWRRIYLDLPGTGKSRRVEPNSDAVLAAVAGTVGEVCGGGPVTLAGCSYGGYLAAGLARREPRLVSSLLLTCTGARILPADRNLGGLLPVTPEPGWLDSVPAEHHEHFSRAVGKQTRAVASRMAAAFALNGASDAEYLRELRAHGYRLSDEGAPQPGQIPITVVAGRRDWIAGYRDQLALLGDADGDYFLYGDGGHYIPFELPGRFGALARNWLARS
jgi:pimeloyl-ACP methyl ester carboxylesterase